MSHFEEINKQFLKNIFAGGLRLDSREPQASRNVVLEFSFLKRGNVQVSMGSTRVLCALTGEIVKPHAQRDSEGMLNFRVSQHGQTTQKEDGFHGTNTSMQVSGYLSRCLEAVLIHSHAISKEMLCIKPGEKVWSITAEVIILSDDGNLQDAVHLAVIAGLMHFRKNKMNNNDSESHGDAIHLYHSPIMRTFCLMKFPDVIFVDPTKEEEKLAETTISIALNEDDQICGIMKHSGVEIPPDIIRRLLDFARPIIQNLRMLLKDSLDKHEKERMDQFNNSTTAKASSVIEVEYSEDIISYGPNVPNSALLLKNITKDLSADTNF